MTTRPHEFPPLPFAVFDEFGKPCDDRVQDHMLRVWSAAPALPEPAVTTIPEGFELIAVKGFAALAEVLERADRKGYLPDVCREEWEAFDYRTNVAVEPAGWRPIETAPKDNKRPLYLARFNAAGELVSLDFNGGWEYWDEGWELAHINGWDWVSASGIEEPTHWAYQDEPLPPAPEIAQAPATEKDHRESVPSGTDPASLNALGDSAQEAAAGADDDPLAIALNVRHKDCHKAADAFWAYWNENGETHKHGYYESTWGAINRALRTVGVVPWNPPTTTKEPS